MMEKQTTKGRSSALGDLTFLALYIGLCLLFFFAWTFTLCSLELFVGITANGPTLGIALGLSGVSIALIAWGREKGAAWKEASLSGAGQSDEPALDDGSADSTASPRVGIAKPLVYGAICCLSVFLLIVGACFLSLMFLDVSYDGNWYHKSSVVALAQGWNPLSNDMFVSPLYSEIFSSTDNMIWSVCYPKGLWEFAACLYHVTGTVESGKCYTLLLAVSGALILSAFLRMKGLRVWQCVILFLIVAINPITVEQFCTYYNDGFLMMSLLALLVGLIMLADPSFERQRCLAYGVIITAFICCSATKFTGFAYPCVFGASFFVLYIWKTVKKRPGFTGKFLVRTVCIFAATALFTFFVINYAPYVLNWMSFGNPFYPLLGAGTVDIMTTNTPDALEGMNSIQAFFVSLFSVISNPVEEPSYGSTLKLPFTILLPKEAADIPEAAIRLSGFGVWFSGVFLITVVILAFMFVLSRKRQPLLFQAGLCYLIPTILLIVGLSESWWARYVPFVYFMVIFAVVFLFFRMNALPWKSWKGALLRLGSLAFLLIIGFNMAFFLVFGTANRLSVSDDMREGIAYLQQQQAEGKRIYAACEGPTRGFAFTVHDLGIDFTVDAYSEKFNGARNIAGVLFRAE